MEAIANEIEVLRKLKDRTDQLTSTKASALFHARALEGFMATIKESYPNANKHFGLNTSANVMISDAIEGFDYYGRSKKKDDHYFHKAKSDASIGLSILISHLQNKKPQDLS